jgi:transposase-like protein
VVVRFSEEDKATIWEMRAAGVPVRRIARHLGRQDSSLRTFIADAGGRRPVLGSGLSFGCPGGA